jgi:hypothetical protein
LGGWLPEGQTGEVLSVEQNRLKLNLKLFQSFLESLKTFLQKGFQRGVGQSPAYSHRTYGVGAPYRSLMFIPWDGPPRTSVPTKFVVFSVEQNRLKFNLKLFQSFLKGFGETFCKKFPQPFPRLSSASYNLRICIPPSTISDVPVV